MHRTGSPPAGDRGWPRRWLLPLAAGVAVLALSGPAAGQVAVQPPRTEGESRAQARPNVLLIMADDLPARIGAYGRAEVKTPNIDRLAHGGVVFQHAYTQYPQCAQSRASMLTGRRPASTRVFDLETHFRKALPDAVTLPQLFKQNGYFTGRVGKIFHQGVPGDIGRSGPDDPASWDEAINPRGRDKEVERQGKLVWLTPGAHIGHAMTLLADEGTDGQQTDGMVADEAIRMLRAKKDGPFFIAAGFYRPHVPSVAPKAYFDLYPLEKIRLEPDTPQELANLPQASLRVLPANFSMSPDEQRQMMQAFYATTSFMDAQVGRVLDELKVLGLADNTIVIFMSDHGYLLGEHGEWGKYVLWEEAVRAPLIIRAPGQARAGVVVKPPVELLDIYPTVAELAGLSAPAELEGRSLADVMKAPRTRWDRPAYSQVRGGRTVRRGKWRYTEWEGGRLGASLFDLEADPKERRNLVDDPAQARTVAALKALLPRETVESRGAVLYYDRAEGVSKPVPYGPKGTRAGETPKPGPEVPAMRVGGGR